jgi:tetratricopeptide (TPR) repeat protein
MAYSEEYFEGEPPTDVSEAAQFFLDKGCFQLERRRLKSALECLLKSRTLAPQRWLTAMVLAETYSALEQPAEAIRQYQDVMRLTPEPKPQAQAAEAIGELFVALGKPSKYTHVWFAGAARFYKKAGLEEESFRAAHRAFEVNQDGFLRDITRF